MVSGNTMLRIGTYDYKTSNAPKIDGFTTIIVHPRKQYKYRVLDPYHIKSPDGYLIENAYQFRKVYENVKAQNQTNYYVGHVGRIKIWQHPAEQHLKLNEQTNILEPTAEYWAWRNKGLNHNLAVRFPAGRTNTHLCKGLITDDGQVLDYLQGRKIYIESYTKPGPNSKVEVREHPLFKDLQQRLTQGENILLCEVDGPQYHDSAPYNTLNPNDKNTWHLTITPQTIKAARWNPNRPFGHGWVLCAMLTDNEQAMYPPKIKISIK